MFTSTLGYTLVPELLDLGDLELKTPAEVIASLNGTNCECVSQRLAAIRKWLATSDGQSYLAELSDPAEDSDDPDESCDLSSASVELVGI